MNQLLMEGSHPERLTQDRTVLIMKDKQSTPSIPANYLYVHTKWKLLSSIRVAKVNRHMGQNLSEVQKKTGTNYQLKEP